MTLFRIPVYWQMSGTVEVEAENLHEALHKANEKASLGEFGLDDVPEHTYVEGTFTVDEEGALSRN